MHGRWMPYEVRTDILALCNMPHSPPLSPAIKYRLLLTFQPPRQMRHSFLRLYIYSLANYRFQTGSTMRAEFTGKNRDTAHASAGRCRNSSAVRALNLKPLTNRGIRHESKTLFTVCIKTMVDSHSEKNYNLHLQVWYILYGHWIIYIIYFRRKSLSLN